MAEKRPKKEHKKAAAKGRPTLYRPEYAEQTFRLCLLGATDADLAAFFKVAESTINLWKEVHADFSESIKEGKDNADANVAQSLYRRALGYEHEAVKIVADAKTGAQHVVPYIERYPPDTVAAIFWLKNRQRGKWRDKHDLEVTTDYNPADLSDEQLKRISAGEDPKRVIGGN